MRATAFLVMTAVVLAVLNFLVWGKERTVRHGRTVFLELAPRDPRSLMQGDYMDLNYAIHGDAERAAPPALPRTGFVVVRLDERGVGSFARFYAGEELKPDECLLRYRVRGEWQRFQIGPRSFFFQEGHAGCYEGAKYGELRVAPSGDCVLVGLRGPDLKPLDPPKQDIRGRTAPGKRSASPPVDRP
ncbi:MAG: GDYXXLXY domain-containing protein [Planctomycetota bacterium]|nr:GDYXXLXY domain-containing protein [Planctomycetota bacterium]